jgi:hypothetical protein
VFSAEREEKGMNLIRRWNRNRKNRVLAVPEAIRAKASLDSCNAWNKQEPEQEYGTSHLKPAMQRFWQVPVRLSIFL